MIPKTLHFCWYGSKHLPYKYARCVETWSKYQTDYKIQRWDEHNTNFDTPFLKDAFQRKKWAFISDYIRMRAIHTYGGIYLDADTEVVKNLDDLLLNQCFIGNEAPKRPTTGIIGSIPRHPFPHVCMEIIDARFNDRLPYLIAPDVAALGLEKIDRSTITIYSEEYFYPYNPYDQSRITNFLMFKDITENTYSIHHWAKGWSDKHKDRVRIRAKRALHNIIKGPLSR